MTRVHVLLTDLKNGKEVELKSLTEVLKDEDF
jgi:hypothetical protein